MSESKKSEVELKDKSIMHQQRRLKQTTQFTHKDSADLLPLDGLKRLGTSKDLQPHSIVQRRLLEGNILRLRGEATPSRVRSPLADIKDSGDTEERSESTLDDSTEEGESPEESEKSLRSEEDEEEEDGESSGDGLKTDVKLKQGELGTEREKARGQMRTDGKERASTLTALLVQCKCEDAKVKVSINTGCQHNHISSTCCRRLGLKANPEIKPLSDSLVNTVISVQLQIGKKKVQCSAQVIDDEAFELRLGLHTLLELKCCVDLNARVLCFHSTGEKLPFLETPTAVSAISMMTTRTYDL